MSKKVRYFHAVQFFINPRTGERLLEEGYINKVKRELDGAKVVKSYAMIIHDKDVYTKDDEDKHLERLRDEYKSLNDNSEVGLARYIEENQYVFEGMTKPKHIHIVITTAPTPTKTSRIADILSFDENKVPENCIEHPKGQHAFEDCALYIIHVDIKQQMEGKYVYEPSCVVSDFDYTAFINQYNEDVSKGKPRNKKMRMLYEVRNEGKTLNECCKEDFELYVTNFDILKKMRNEYLKNANPPDYRLNIYVYGKGGVGKDILCRAIARALYPNKRDEEVFYVVGASKVSFEAYDGQPVIIWSDRRAGGLIGELGRENLLNILDPHPCKSIQNIKYGSVNLINSINIINGQESYDTFLNSLSGEYYSVRDDRHYSSEDKGQFYRRFPIIVHLQENEYDLYVNKSWISDTRDYEDYAIYQGINMNLVRLVRAFNEDTKEFNAVVSKAIKPIIDNIDLVSSEQDKDIEIPDMNEFKDYGETDKMNDSIFDIDIDKLLKM